MIDVRGREAVLAGRPLSLTPIEFDLLMYLATHPGWVVSPEQLMEEVWGYRSFGDTRALGVHVGHLRRKLGDSSEEPRYIQTVRGAGYKLVARAEGTPAATPPEGTDMGTALETAEQAEALLEPRQQSLPTAMSEHLEAATAAWRSGDTADTERRLHAALAAAPPSFT